MQSGMQNARLRGRIMNFDMKWFLAPPLPLPNPPPQTGEGANVKIAYFELGAHHEF